MKTGMRTVRTLIEALRSCTRALTADCKAVKGAAELLGLRSYV